MNTFPADSYLFKFENPKGVTGKSWELSVHNNRLFPRTAMSPLKIESCGLLKLKY